MLVIIQFITSHVKRPKPPAAPPGAASARKLFISIPMRATLQPEHPSPTAPGPQGRNPGADQPAALPDTMNTELPDELAQTFTPERLDCLVDGLETTYERVPSREEVPGFNNVLVGQSLYWLPGFSLPEHAADEGLELAEEANALLYRLGGVVFSCQRVSDTVTDIQGAFPRSYKACAQYHRGQSQFEFMEERRAESLPLVLAHMGNNRDGLLAVYLCRPSWVEDGKVRAWEFAYEVFTSSTQRSGIPVGEQVPAVEQVEEPLVLPRREKPSGSEA